MAKLRTCPFCKGELFIISRERYNHIPLCHNVNCALSAPYMRREDLAVALNTRHTDGLLRDVLAFVGTSQDYWDYANLKDGVVARIKAELGEG